MLVDTGLGEVSWWDRMNHTKELAARNPSVTDLQFYKPEDVDVVNFHYRVGRDVDGRISAVVEVKNGMYCCSD